MAEERFDSASARRTGCPNCGGGLRFDIEKQAMVCALCGSEIPVDRLSAEDAREDTIEATAYQCPQCGAEIYTDSETQAAGHCVFCGSDVVLTGRLSRIRRPEKIVPFQITREQCAEIYKKHLSKYFLAPAALKKQEVAESFQPVYVPFWSYRISAEGETDGYLGYHIKTGTRKDVHTQYRIHADVRVEDDSPFMYDASQEFEDETGHRLMFDLKQGVPYHTGYFSGFYVQAANVTPETYQADAGAFVSQRLMKHLKTVCTGDLKYVDVDCKAENWGLPDPKARARLVMLPVWLLTRRSEGRVLYTAINGVNGTIVCDPPVSHLRTIGLTALLMAAVFFVLQGFLNLKPDLMAALSAGIAVTVQFYLTKRLKIHARNEQADAPALSEGEQYLEAVKKNERMEGKRFGQKYPTSDRLSSVRGTIFGICAILAVAFFYINARLGGQLNLTPLFAGASLVLLIILHFTDLKPRGIQAICRYLAAGVMALLLAFLLTGQFEDLLYYGCAAALLLLSAIPVVVLNNRHNTYVTRPVPFFNREEGAAS